MGKSKIHGSEYVWIFINCGGDFLGDVGDKA